MHSEWPHDQFSGLFHHHTQASKTFTLGGGPSVVQDFLSKLPPRRGMEQRQECIPIWGAWRWSSHLDGQRKGIHNSLSWTNLLSSVPKSNQHTTLLCASHTCPKPRASLQHGLFSDLIAPRKRGPKSTHITKKRSKTNTTLFLKHEAAANPIPLSTSPELCWPALLVQLLSVRIGRDSSKPAHNPHLESKNQA